MEVCVRRAVSAVIAAVLLASAALLVSQCGSPAQSGQAATKEQADAILTELRGIRESLDRLVPQLAGEPAPAKTPAPGRSDANVRLANVAAFALGRPDAPLTLVEFTDLQCPYCSRFASTTFVQIKKTYIDTGMLRFVTRDLPLPFHQQAMRAARACRCAADQKKFWEMRETLARNAARLSREFMLSAAADLKMDAAAFGQCLDGTQYLAEVEKDIKEGAALGIQGTPGFVLARNSGPQLDGIRLMGALPFAAFDERIKALLAPPATRPPAPH